jgi:hypothetical protein
VVPHNKSRYPHYKRGCASHPAATANPTANQLQARRVGARRPDWGNRGRRAVSEFPAGSFPDSSRRARGPLSPCLVHSRFQHSVGGFTRLSTIYRSAVIDKSVGSGVARIRGACLLLQRRPAPLATHRAASTTSCLHQLLHPEIGLENSYCFEKNLQRETRNRNYPVGIYSTCAPI